MIFWNLFNRRTKKMPDKIMSILAEATGGKSYKAHKYGLDHADRPFIDYGEDSRHRVL